MFLLKLSETDSMRVVRGPDVHRWGLCLRFNNVQGDWHLPENNESTLSLETLWRTFCCLQHPSSTTGLAVGQ